MIEKVNLRQLGANFAIAAIAVIVILVAMNSCADKLERSAADLSAEQDAHIQQFDGYIEELKIADAELRNTLEGVSHNIDALRSDVDSVQVDVREVLQRLSENVEEVAHIEEEESSPSMPVTAAETCFGLAFMNPDFHEKSLELLNALGVQELDGFTMRGGGYSSGESGEVLTLNYEVTDESGKRVHAITGIVIDPETCEATLMQNQ